MASPDYESGQFREGFNMGVFSLAPSTSLFDELHNHALTKSDYRLDTAEQGMMQSIYSKREWFKLPFSYNGNLAMYLQNNRQWDIEYTKGLNVIHYTMLKPFALAPDAKEWAWKPMQVWKDMANKMEIALAKAKQNLRVTETPKCPEPYLYVSPEDAPANATVIYTWNLQFEEERTRFPEYSLCLTINNRQDTVEKQLLSIMKNAGPEPYEIIIVLDNCRDQTEQTLLEVFSNDSWFKQFWPHLIRILVIKTPDGVSLFETRCNNMALRSAWGKYLILIQDDMFITEPDFNIKLVQPLKQFNDVLAVSGRCAHHWYSLKPLLGNTGRCIGTEMDKPLQASGQDKCTLFVRDTVNRGPLALSADKLKMLNYLDEEHYTLENDDHDLMLRAYLIYDWKCGVRQISFDAPSAIGGSRRPGRTPEESAFLEARKHRIAASFMSQFMKNNDHLPLSHDENRLIVDCAM
jgi:hypothetical protein